MDGSDSCFLDLPMLYSIKFGSDALAGNMSEVVLLILMSKSSKENRSIVDLPILTLLHSEGYTFENCQLVFVDSRIGIERVLFRCS